MTAAEHPVTAARRQPKLMLYFHLVSQCFHSEHLTVQQLCARLHLACPRGGHLDEEASGGRARVQTSPV